MPFDGNLKVKQKQNIYIQKNFNDADMSYFQQMTVFKSLMRFE